MQRKEEEGKPEAINERPSVKTHPGNQQTWLLGALMPFTFWQRLAIWNFKRWRVLCFSTMERDVLSSNFSCLLWRKTFPGSKYLIHKYKMHPSRANWVRKLHLRLCSVMTWEPIQLQDLSSLTWYPLVSMLGSIWCAWSAPLSSSSLNSYS